MQCVSVPSSKVENKQISSQVPSAVLGTHLLLRPQLKKKEKFGRHDSREGTMSVHGKIKL